MFQSLSVHLSVDGCLLRLHFTVTGNSVDGYSMVNMDIQVSHCTYPRVVQLSHVLILPFVF